MTVPAYMSTLPGEVRHFASSVDFVAEDSDRLAFSWEDSSELSGWSVGEGFTIAARPGSPGTHWRLMVGDREVFAVQRPRHGAPGESFDGAVLLIDVIPEVLASAVDGRPLRRFMERFAKLREVPDSLVWAVAGIRSGFTLLRDVTANPHAVAAWASNQAA